MSKLIDIKNNQNDQEKNDKLFNAILDDIIKKAAAKKVKIMRPLDNNPLEYMEQLIRAE